MSRALSVLWLLLFPPTLWAVDGNLLSYLQDPANPYYVHGNFPKLTTPQWFGEPGVDAVVVLAIDDMRDPDKYEAYLRPILDRLKQRDGRASVSIMTNAVEPHDSQLQTWIAEGLSFDVHTIDHPCPCLHGGDLAKARSTYERCVDLLHQIPGNQPAAFRMPCCDSQNTPSPRFWTEIFNQRTPAGNYLSIDSSVFNIITPRDADLPAETFAADKNRFRKYLPFPSFVNTIQDYPYPYLIAGTCLEFPCVVPSDWEAQHLHQPNNPVTVKDMAAALDAVVAKKGVYNLVFHPHGWIRAEQIVQLIDHADHIHGKRVKFLTFQSALTHIQQHLLGGRALRSDAENYQVLLLDANNDGFQDVFIRDGDAAVTRSWVPSEQQWSETTQPWPYRDAKFELYASDKGASAIVTPMQGGLRRLNFRDGQWWAANLDFEQGDSARNWLAHPQRLDAMALRDIDRDGSGELILGRGGESVIFSAADGKKFKPMPWALPSGVRLATAEGGDAGLRFVDVNGDDYVDCIYSNGERYSVHLFTSMATGWSQEITASQRDQPTPAPIPMIVRSDGTNNGAWFHSQHLWVQNEDTSRLADNVDRISYRDLTKPVASHNAKYGGLPGPLSPADGLRSIQTTPGVQVELVAAEPLIEDPVAFDWGADGRLWVAEMRGYPNGMDGQGKPGGRIKVLDDDDGDGRYDRATTFLEDVSFPAGLKAWKRGVLVAAAPEVFYAADTDGDGQADERQVLYRGFTEGNQQHRVNGLRFGIDGWLYLANGDSGGEVESVQTGQKVPIRGRDLRIRPDTGELEAIAGQTQFGRNQDDFGNWFGGNNSEPMWHYVLDDGLQARNRSFAAPSSRKLVPQRPGPAPVFPVSETVERFNDFDRANRFTSACSPIVYRDHLLGDPQQTYSFVCEPVHNLVHRELLSASGASFASARLPEERASEFVASTDTWFRPVMVRTGPDGGLWIADMYRLVIEHPEWIPAAWQAKLDVRSGDDRGRIYRVFDPSQQRRKLSRVDQLSTGELVKELDHPNGTVRDMVHQHLLWRNDKQAVGPLWDIVGNATYPSAQVHALYLLHDWAALENTKLAAIIRDADSEVSRHAVRLAGPLLGESDEIGVAIQSRAATNAAWDLQAAYALGGWNDPRAEQALADILLRQAADQYIVAAVMSSLTADNVSGIAEHVHQQARTTDQLAVLTELLTQLVAIGKGQARQVALALLFDEETPPRSAEWRWLTLSQLLARTKKNSTQFAVGPQQESSRQQFVQAREVAVDAAARVGLRLAAVKLLGFDPTSRREDLGALHGLVTPRVPLDVQLAALARIEALGDEGSVVDFERMFRECSPRVRSRVAAMIASRDAWALTILRAMSQQEVRTAWFDARQRQQLASHGLEEIQQLAQALFFDDGQRSSRDEIVARYLDVDPAGGDPARGQQVFAKSCATCHRWGDVGHHVGPDLAALSRRTPEALLTAILDPNRSLEAPYVDYAVFTEEGLRYSGIIAAESESAVTLLGPDGKRQTILRSDIDAIQSTNLSLMPEGLEKDLSHADLADLLAFLGSRAEQPKQFAGNSPQLAPVRDDGSIRLFAVHAEIYGPTLVFEDTYSNLGYWDSIGDRAVWKMKPRKSGRYKVIMDYACTPEAAGNPLRISIDDQTLAGRVESTGSWDNYRRATLGEVELDETETSLIFRSDGPIQGHLVDLRTIFLYPED